MMNILFYCIFTILIFAGDARPSIHGRIIGGESTTIEEFPYQVAVEVDRQQVCGASILNSTVILTAAHCVENIPNKSIRIRAGTTKREKGGVLRNVDAIIMHELYNTTTIDYDVSLIVLTEPLEFSSAISPVTLPNEDEYLDAPETGVVTGWGVIDGPLFPKQLQKVYLDIFTQKRCSEIYSENVITLVTPRMICAGVNGEGDRGICGGDSGGPLVSQNKLHGIASWSQICGGNTHPAIFTRVTAIRQWIRAKVNL
ncbi:trypsin-1-like [Chrysoperla carnea]|uniref:trypsin-1-like n=1 Tax=Chrysoperla carnea TaxID=189513 RepID=UPI001D09191B|nr:trypsin-1-like [Chrysoperla carnea]